MASTSNKPCPLTIDNFYENQKKIYDICGNVINKDKYLFIDILSTYLNEIVISIDVEIKNSARNSMINWREKKNPKLLSRFINNDDNINLINRSMNKITSANYMTIVEEINETLLQDNFRRLPDYCKYIFDIVIKKCLAEENFTKDYIQFLFGFSDNIAKYISQYITQFIKEVRKVSETNENIKDFTYFSYIKDIVSYKNIGCIYANIYIVLSANPTAKTQYNIDLNDNTLCENISQSFDIINSFLDWMPVNMDELNSRLYLMVGTMENVLSTIWYTLTEAQRNIINDTLNLAYNMNNIHNKIKFKILDIQDIIKHIKPLNTIATAPTAPTAPNAPNAPNAPVKTISKQSVTVDVSTTVVPSKPNPWNRISVNNNNSSAPNNSTNTNTNTNTNNSININTVKTNDRYKKSENRESASRDRRNNSRNNDRNNDRNRNDNLIVRNKNSNQQQTEEVVRKNMFSSLETNDNDVTGNNIDDGFIKIERKNNTTNTSNANIYRPKKTIEMALEGSKIYSAPNNNSDGKAKFNKKNKNSK